MNEQRLRYPKASPLTTQLAAGLGLRGFRLNLALESAQGYEGLVALMPKRREAAGAAKVQALQDELEGRA